MVRLAFVIAIQALPPRQRAVLILRDVVGLSADETAEAIESSIAATNSALQRARARLTVGFPDGPPGPLNLDDEGRHRLARYVETWQAGDIDGHASEGSTTSSSHDSSPHSRFRNGWRPLGDELPGPRVSL